MRTLLHIVYKTVLMNIIKIFQINEGEYVGTISLLKPLDYEQRSGYSLVLKATDVASEPSARLTAIANVAIDVMDVQDQPPIFVNAPFSATVAEATAPVSNRSLT
jgi:hypothetical protein